MTNQLDSLSPDSYDFKGLRRQYTMLNWLQKRYLKKNFDKKKAKEWTSEAKIRFDELLPEIPYIGGKDHYFTRYLIMTAMLTPIVSILDQAGIPEREIGKLIFDMAESYYKIIPKFIRKKQGKKLFTQESKDLWKTRCLESQQRDISFDWTCEYVEGGKEDDFDYGINMIKCGNVEFWEQQGLGKYVPYLCLCDWPGWKASNIEASRTKTLAQGDEHCDFRYVRYGKNGKRGWPPETLEEWKEKEKEK